MGIVSGSYYSRFSLEKGSKKIGFLKDVRVFAGTKLLVFGSFRSLAFKDFGFGSCDYSFYIFAVTHNHH